MKPIEQYEAQQRAFEAERFERNLRETHLCYEEDDVDPEPVSWWMIAGSLLLSFIAGVIGGLVVAWSTSP